MIIEDIIEDNYQLYEEHNEKEDKLKTKGKGKQINTFQCEAMTKIKAIGIYRWRL